MELFKKEDFADRGLDILTHRGMASYFNRILKERLLDKGMPLYGPSSSEVPANWNEERGSYDKYKGILVCVEPLEEKKVTVTRKDLERAYEKTAHADSAQVFLASFAKELGL